MPWWWNGRHDGLKSHCPQGREGSTPSRGTLRFTQGKLLLTVYAEKRSDEAGSSSVG